MTVRKLDTGKWLCECYPQGRNNQRVRKTFPTKGEAVSFEQFIMNEIASRPWMAEKSDNRTLKELAELWYSLHGQSLRAGLMVYRKLLHMADALGNPRGTSFTANDFAHYRKERLSGEVFLDSRFANSVSKSTLNMDHSYLTSMFNELTRLGEWKRPNPLANLRKLTTVEREMSWLTQDNVRELLSLTTENESLDLMIRICLSTGARWSEAQNLKRSQVIPYKITYTNTKSGKNRTVPISKPLYEALVAIRAEALFPPCLRHFEQAIKASSIILPKGQMTHVLRHSFAAHFMMNGGNILVLQKILGHSDISMTMRYAHFAPEHLETAITHNPVSTLENGDKMAT